MLARKRVHVQANFKIKQFHLSGSTPVGSSMGDKVLISRVKDQGANLLLFKIVSVLIVFDKPNVGKTGEFILTLLYFLRAFLCKFATYLDFREKRRSTMGSFTGIRRHNEE